MTKTITLFLVYFYVFSNSFAQTGWAWMKGQSGPNGNPVFGTMGIPAPGNTPQSLYETAEWTDLDGNFWTFGGMLSSTFAINTLWKYDPVINQWTWVDGSQNCCEIGDYGVQGIPDPSNYPGARKWAAATWTDLDGNFWLFGGTGYDAFGSNADLNDLWKYDISTGEWTWMKGSNVVNASGTYGTQGQSSPLNDPSARHECGARWVDNDGNLWIFGGVDYNFSFLNDMWRYDILTNEWTWMKGSNQPSGAATYGTLGVPSPSNTPGARSSYNKWKDSAGNFWIFGGYDFNDMNDLWRFDPVNNEWTWMGGPNNYSNSAGNYSAYCNSDTLNLPAARLENRTCWVDDEDRLWMFGGYTLISSTECFNDLWYYEISSGKWNWISGSNGGSPIGAYGTQGVPDPANHPGGRGGSVGWYDSNCEFWLFGGTDLYNGAYYNDLWKFIPDVGCGNCAALPQNTVYSSDTTLCEKFCVDFFDSSTNVVSWEWLFPGGIPPLSSDQNPADICYYNAGIYDVTLITTNSIGVIDTLTLVNYITVYTNPQAPTITQTGNLLESTPADSYQWLMNSVAIPGATNQTLTISQSALYAVVISDSNGCTAQSSIDATIATGIFSEPEEIFLLYPNPSDGLFVIAWTNARLVNDIRIEITDQIGKVVFSSLEKSADHFFKKEIDLESSTSGVYFIEVNIDGEMISEKILILR